MVDTIRIDARKMTFTNVKINGKPVNFKPSAVELLLFDGFRKGKNTLTFDYSAVPAQTLYFTGQGTQTQFWTQGQGKYTSHWLPSFDDTNEKLVFLISVWYPEGFEVISNGELSAKSRQNGLIRWDYKMDKPMSSYLVMMAGGNYLSQTLKSASGIPQVLYYLPADRDKFEPTYRYSVRMFDFMERETGVPYPWKIYRQIPVRDFLYAGMENTSATVFAQDFVVDSIAFTDKNYVNVNAHELAHQWFGNLVTAKSREHHWLQEGFATYYALLAEREIFGDDHFYHKLHSMASNLRQASAKDTIPILSTRASSLTYYQKGAWAVHMLREQVGAETFRSAVRTYLKKYAFGSVDTDAFLNELASVSGKDFSQFRTQWLEQGGFRFEEAVAQLRKNAMMRRYFELLEKVDEPLEAKQALFGQILASDENHMIKEEVLYQLESVPFEQKKELIVLAMKSGLQTRQAVARTLGKFPPDFFDAYATLLDDDSYITSEIALNVAWSQFPEKRAVLLERTRGNTGFNDRNLEIQWLTLALLTPDFDSGRKLEYYDRLLELGSTRHESSVRINALTNLLYLNPTDKNVLALLPSTLVHHKWQMTAFGREKVRGLLPNKNVREYFGELLQGLPLREKEQLERLLAEKPRD